MSWIEVVLGNEYFLALAKLVLAFAVATLLHGLFRLYTLFVASHTRTKLDEKLFGALTRPLYLLVLAIGLERAVLGLKIFSEMHDWLKGAFFVIYVFIVTFVLARAAKVLVPHWFRQQKGYEKTPMLITNGVRLIIYLIAILVIFDHFSIEITPMIATLGIGGLAVGLALNSTLSNLFAGLHLISDKPINVGDFIEIDANTSGFVEDIGWRSTRIRKFSQDYIIVPNAKLADSIIVNYSQPMPETTCKIRVGVSYNSDLEKVEKVTLAVAKRIIKQEEGAVKSFEPFMRYSEFGESNIYFNVFIKANSYVDTFRITHEFIKALKKEYNKQGIEISWPVRKLYYGK